ncbi:unnamed protein product [Pedinophyceae sp. YPF-701]|nr:unnamed protein product [Pedinophyceae sp. YPF-701]
MQEESPAQPRDSVDSSMHGARVGPMAESTTSAGSARTDTYESWKAQFPCILGNFQTFADESHGKRVVIFLDYDGTLTPIVNDPDKALLSDGMRETIQQLAKLFPTAIVSGRARAKVEAFVRLDELMYAGSHGLDIATPLGVDEHDLHHVSDHYQYQPAQDICPLMDELHDKLVAALQGIPGASVEHNKYCLSVHWRNCADRHGEVRAIVDAHVDPEHPRAKVTRGRKVFEIRPRIDWDKGRALSHLLALMQLTSAPDVLPIYIGDDRTDEDAFRVLHEAGAGFGVLVSSIAKPTTAKYTLRDPAEVQSFLQRLVAHGRCPRRNAWLSGNGLTLAAKAARGHEPGHLQIWRPHPDAPGAGGGECCGDAEAQWPRDAPAEDAAAPLSPLVAADGGR